MPEARRNILLLTAHDYRTPRKAWMHFFADEFAKLGKMRFFSLRYSCLSRWRPDGRHPVAPLANRLETVNGVDCYLWKTLLHPFNLKLPFLRALEALTYALYVRAAPPLLHEWIRQADTIFFESGISPVFFETVKKLNPKAQTIYLTSDTLDSIHVAGYVKSLVRRLSTRFDRIWLPSKRMRQDFAPGARLFFAPQGIDASIARHADPSPYKGGKNAVSIGSMLFDSGFFDLAGRAFPDVTFHVIGCGRKRPESWPENVVHYDEMPFDDTIAYIKHASVALAPYLPASIPPSLADTSMKLFQYGFFGVPSVCPHEVVGDYPLRFGYKAGDAESVVAAMRAALAADRGLAPKVLTWPEVAARLLDPDAFPDTKVEA